MAVNNTVSTKEYKLTGTGTSRLFPITFEYTTDSSGNAENIHCQFATKGDDGTYSYSEEIAQGMASDQFQVDHGNVKYIDDESNLGQNNYIVIYRSTPPSQLTDFIDNGSYSLEDIEKALDKLTFLIQERTGTPSGTYINIGVSLFFANLLQLVAKKDVLETLFTWTDIAVADQPVLAGKIRSAIDALSANLSQTVDGTKTFLQPPVVPTPTSATHATNKDYVDTQISSHIIDTAHLKQTSGAQAVTTATMRDSAVTTAKIANSNVTTANLADGNVTTGKIADNAVTLTKMRRGSDNVSVTIASGDNYYGNWYNGGNKIPYYVIGGGEVTWQIATLSTYAGQIQLRMKRGTSGTATVYYVY